MERGNSFDSQEERRFDSQNSLKFIILSKLLDSVKQCQSEFGAKHELATSDNTRVGFLLAQLETALLHGLRKNSFLKDVTDLVAKFSAFDLGVSATLWSFVKRILNEQEIRRISEFSYITSDAGRARCWLRMALNERSLRRYYDMMNSSNLLGEYYEDWAFLRDSEVTAAFAQIATGLETILFALNTNDPELNVPFSINEDASQNLLEAKKVPQPILNVTRERKDSSRSDVDKKELKKRRPLVNLVSFDKDRSFSEADGQMRVILPRQSSRQSVESTNEPPILYFDKSDSINDKLDAVFRGETPSEDPDDISVECGSFDSNGDETPAEDTNPCKLSVRCQSNSTVRKSSDASSQTNNDLNLCKTNENNIVISRKEICFCNGMNEIQELQNSIRILKSALESLRQEHNDFIRIQNSRMNTIKLECNTFQTLAHNSNNNTDDGDNTLGQGSVDDELALVYEKRLTELTQMHGELLELNESLLKQNRRKTAVNERLKKELIALRGPLPEDLMTDYDDATASNKFEERPLVNIWIPSAFLTGKGSDVHHVYQVYIRIRESEWNIYRRYNDFLLMHNQLSKRDPTIKKFKFPPKKNFGRKDKGFVDERRIGLESYLRMVVNYIVQNFPEFCSIPVSRETLAQLMPFFR